MVQLNSEQRKTESERPLLEKSVPKTNVSTKDTIVERTLNQFPALISRPKKFPSENKRRKKSWNVQNQTEMTLSSKSPNRKLTQSRGITLPVIKLNDETNASSPHVTHQPQLLRFGFNRHTIDPSTVGKTINSPVGYTLRHSAELSHSTDMNRSIASESFNMSTNHLSHTDSGTVDMAENILDIRIFYPNGKAARFLVDNGILTPASALLARMAERLDIDPEVAEDTLALWLVSPLLEVQLKPHHVAFEVHEKWPVFLRKFTVSEEEEIALDEPLLVIRRNVQLTIANEILYIDEFERLTEVLYWDAKDQYMSGRYVVSAEIAVELAALQMAIEFGPFESVEETLDLIHDNLGQLVPPQHMTTIRSFHLFGITLMECRRGLENRLVDEYRNTASQHFQSGHKRRKAFLTLLQSTPFYGAAFFTGTRERKVGLLSSVFGPWSRRWHHQTKISIGINQEFISVVDSHRHDLLICQRISDCWWAKSPEPVEEHEIPMFVLQYPSVDPTPDSPKSPVNPTKIQKIGSEVELEQQKNAKNCHFFDSKWRIQPDTIQVPFNKETNEGEVFNYEDECGQRMTFVNKEIYSKQASMMEALLNSLCASNQQTMKAQI